MEKVLNKIIPVLFAVIIAFDEYDPVIVYKLYKQVYKGLKDPPTNYESSYFAATMIYLTK